ncbi:thioesterase II family protein [Streptantibioticus silvisoli]|uniref:Thioesterase domain-containing protein n=1 Tax=Streptantibioticus silvisoli TaxID=2705255 RepID=A0ABT6W9S2_9ACTN|nr:thioesterase domain-containing protein [Streptantibioticus silvisoli]MDI5967120.1 thioesterase domain-containing protein [Streptantibioticus silvisoli]
MARRTPADRWLPFGDPVGGVRLYCLPHAGGAASSFRPWIGRLGAVAVRPLQPPGRETRQGDAPYPDMGALVGELAGVVLTDTRDGPYAVYGHSLGALVGFELIHEIRRLGGPAPAHFVVSGCSAPQWDKGESMWEEAGLTDERIIELLRTLGGTPEAFLSNPTVLRMILPALRADLAVKDGYRYVPRPPLDVPITALAGTEDLRADVESITAWREQTVSRFRTHLLDGGHFAVLEQQETTLRHLRDVLSAWSGTTV